jgi:ribosomal-protein-alanine N-acetyltransferase
MITIREMNADDVPDVMKIERASFNEPWAEVHFYFDIYTKSAHDWVALSGNELCAYLCFWKIEDEVHINNIAVKETFRRQGVAQKMLDKLNAFALKKKITLMTLEVSEYNENAKRFYMKNGFERVGIRKNYYRHEQADAWILTKRLETK